ncbi:ice-binding family protein [Flavobacterium lacus]|uniref:Uncharacterized protein DUF3494 n=1 Tax=Flavobacterium lacus TaxID=1353778 RepID=A0A328WUK9_9FLAO|nr:ice-binding family protein [Flavobacterium lacus]RAR47058.1 uncharacterized protein DUF3494 [Flavobacterium lacus]
MRKITLCYKGTFCISFFLYFCFIFNASAQCSVNFGASSQFALFTVSGAVGNTGISSVTGDIGTHAGAITGFETPTQIYGTIHNPGDLTYQASADLLTAFNELLNTSSTNGSHTPAFGNGETLFAGVYSIGGAGSVAGTLTLDGEGNPDARFIFKFGGAFTAGAGSTIILTNQAKASNIYWIAEGAVSMAASTTISGTFIANGGAISMGAGSQLNGRLYSTTGAVSIYSTTIDTDGFGIAVGGITSANQTICLGILPTDLELTGNSGNVQKWQKSLDSNFTFPVDINCTTTTLPGLTIGSINETNYYRAVVQSLECEENYAFSSYTTITIQSTTWANNQWSNGVPDENSSVIISDDFTSTGNISYCSLWVLANADIIISSGDTLTLNGILIVENEGSLTLENEANLIQLSDVENIGSIFVKKRTSPLMRLDYVMWSSPVSDQLLQNFSPFTLPNRFYNYNPTTNIYTTVLDLETITFESAKGYLIRMPDDHSQTPLLYEGIFEGKPNNGNITIPVTENTYNAIGNPYPSSIDANQFILENNLQEPIYFWRKTNNSNHDSYATYTTAGGAGGVANNDGGAPLFITPNENIASGQGFIVKANSSNLIFTNAMRTATNETIFLRANSEINRIWLNLNNANEYICQTMIAYMPNATSGIDISIDGKYIHERETALTSLIGEKEFSIQGRGLPFDSNDVVFLGFKTQFAGNHTISLNQYDGLFNSNQTVFLKDNYNTTLHDLKLGDYTFSSEIGTFNSRFEIVYQDVLGINQSEYNDSIIVYNTKNDLFINSKNSFITKVDVYDVYGRLILSKKMV